MKLQLEDFQKPTVSEVDDRTTVVGEDTFRKEGIGGQVAVVVEKKADLVELNRMDQDSALVELNRMDQEVRENECATPDMNSDENTMKTVEKSANKSGLVELNRMD